MPVSPRRFVEREGQLVGQRVQLEVIIPTILIDALIFPPRNHSQVKCREYNTSTRQVSGDGQLARIPWVFDVANQNVYHIHLVESY